MTSTTVRFWNAPLALRAGRRTSAAGSSAPRASLAGRLDAPTASPMSPSVSPIALSGLYPSNGQFRKSKGPGFVPWPVGGSDVSAGRPMVIRRVFSAWGRPFRRGLLLLLLLLLPLLLLLLLLPCTESETPWTGRSETCPTLRQNEFLRQFPAQTSFFHFGSAASFLTSSLTF